MTETEKQYLKNYRIKNREKLNLYQRQYYKRNREKFCKKSRDYYWKNKEKILKYQRRYREEHREELNAKRRKRYYEKRMSEAIPLQEEIIEPMNPKKCSQIHNNCFNCPYEDCIQE